MAKKKLYVVYVLRDSESSIYNIPVHCLAVSSSHAMTLARRFCIDELCCDRDSCSSRVGTITDGGTSYTTGSGRKKQHDSKYHDNNNRQNLDPYRFCNEPRKKLFNSIIHKGQ